MYGMVLSSPKDWKFPCCDHPPIRINAPTFEMRNSLHLLEKVFSFKLSWGPKVKVTAIGRLLESIWMYHSINPNGQAEWIPLVFFPRIDRSVVAYCGTSIRMNTGDSATGIEVVHISGHHLDTSDKKKGYNVDLSYQQIFIGPYQLTPRTFIWLTSLCELQTIYSTFLAHVHSMSILKKDALMKT